MTAPGSLRCWHCGSYTCDELCQDRAEAETERLYNEDHPVAKAKVGDLDGCDSDDLFWRYRHGRPI